MLKNNAEEALCHVKSCLSDIVSWIHINMLKPNTEKREDREVTVFFYQNIINILFVIYLLLSVHLRKSVTSCHKSLRILWLWKVTLCRCSYAQLGQIDHTRQIITSDVTKSLVNSLVTFRLDYCDFLLYGVPKNTLKKPQTVQNTAAGIMSKTSRSCHISSFWRSYRQQN